MMDILATNGWQKRSCTPNVMRYFNMAWKSYNRKLLKQHVSSQSLCTVLNSVRGVLQLLNLEQCVAHLYRCTVAANGSCSKFQHLKLRGVKHTTHKQELSMSMSFKPSILHKMEMIGLHVNPQYSQYLSWWPNFMLLLWQWTAWDGMLIQQKGHWYPTQIVDSSFYLKPTQSGLKLSEPHDYYHQVQRQMTICECLYCNFICWTPLGMHIESELKGISVTFSTWNHSLTAPLLVSYCSRCCVNSMEMTRKTVNPTKNCFAFAEKGNTEAW